MNFDIIICKALLVIIFIKVWNYLNFIVQPLVKKNECSDVTKREINIKELRRADFVKS